MNLKELYKEIEESETSLAKKRNEYARKALKENGGVIELEYNPFFEDFSDNDGKTFDDQFPEFVMITGNRYDMSVAITKVYEKNMHGRGYLLMDGIDLNVMNKYEGYDVHDMGAVCRFINYCLNQKENEKEQENV